MPVQHVRLGEDRLTSRDIDGSASLFLETATSFFDEQQLRSRMDMPIGARA